MPSPPPSGRRGVSFVEDAERSARESAALREKLMDQAEQIEVGPKNASTAWVILLTHFCFLSLRDCSGAYLGGRAIAVRAQRTVASSSPGAALVNGQGGS
jgi:hypothetical protein